MAVEPKIGDSGAFCEFLRVLLNIYDTKLAAAFSKHYTSILRQ
jgi:hypothetical protein